MIANLKRKFLYVASCLVIVFCTSTSMAQQPQEELPLTPNQVRMFLTIVQHIRSNYVEPVDSNKLMENALKGMLSGLDPHSSYMNPQDFADMRAITTEQFGGLGIQVEPSPNGAVKVVAPIDDSPASRAGIKSGDLIIKVDTTAVQQMSIDNAVKLMKGTPGTSVVLTIFRKGESKLLHITLVREIIHTRSVKSNTLEPGYVYIRVSGFDAPTGDDLLAAVVQRYKENKGNVKGIILDLRNNPGGLITSAGEVASIFLKSKLVVTYTKGRNAQNQETLYSDDTEIAAKLPKSIKTVPLVVLVNGGSASASELVTGAFQDYHRGVVVGTQTFGKGSVQEIIPFDGGALRLTIARYFTPKGRSIQAKGITPDVVVEQAKLTPTPADEIDQEIKEADLEGHLSNPQDAIAQKAQATNGKTADQEKDYQLNEALTILKALQIVQR